MNSMESISAAIQSIPAKKDALRQALELLDGRSPIPLRWSDLQPHFDALQASIESRFRGLEASAMANPNPNSNLNPDHPNPNSNSTSNSNHDPNPSPPAPPVSGGGGESGGKEEKVEMPARPALKELCAKMDAAGLRQYIVEKKEDVLSIREEVAGALQCAGDPAKLVLDVIDAFYRPAAKADKEEFSGVRRVCLLLLDKLLMLPAEVRAKGRDRALALARVSMALITDSQQNLLENRAFLQLVVTFDLYSAFGWDVLCSYIVDKVTRRKQVVDLCRAIFPIEKVPELVEKLISKGKHLDALHYAYEFGVEDKFPPDPILTAYLEEAKKIAIKSLHKEGNPVMNKNEAIAKEASAVRAVIKFIEERKLVSTLSPVNLKKRVAEIESQKSGKKRPATLNQSPKKRQSSAASSSAAGVLQAVPHMRSQQQQQPVAGMIDRVPAYVPHAGGWSYSVTAGPALAGLGILGGGPSRMGISQTESHLYPSGPYMASVGGLHERPVSLSGGVNHRYSVFP